MDGSDVQDPAQETLSHSAAVHVEVVGLGGLLGRGGARGHPVAALGPQHEDRSPQGLLAGRVLSHRQGRGALPSFPAVPVATQVGGAQTRLGSQGKVGSPTVGGKSSPGTHVVPAGTRRLSSGVRLRRCPSIVTTEEPS